MHIMNYLEQFLIIVEQKENLILSHMFVHLSKLENVSKILSSSIMFSYTI